MLKHSVPAPQHCNSLSDANESGVLLEVDGSRIDVPWAMIVRVSAGRALLDRTSGVWILVLAVEIVVGNEVRLFIVGEVEPAWLALTAILPSVLPGIEPFEIWGAKVITASEPVELYQRDAE